MAAEAGNARSEVKMPKMRFPSATKLKINQLLDGEPLKRILPRLTGRESEAEILKQLEKKRKDAGLWGKTKRPVRSEDEDDDKKAADKEKEKDRKLYRDRSQYRPRDW